MDTASILREIEGQTKDKNVKNLVMVVTSPVVSAFNKTGSPYIQLVHSAGQFRGDPFNSVEYQGEFIGFVGDMIMGVSPITILLE